MGVVYRMTMEEMQLLSSMTLSEDEILYSGKVLTLEAANEAFRGLERKGYLKKRGDTWKADRIMAGLMQVLAGAKKESFGSEDARECLYIHEKMAVLCIRDLHSGSHYKLIPFPDKQAFLMSEYAKGQ